MFRCSPTVHIRAARKRHRCDWCDTIIEAGRPYAKYRIYWDGDDASTIKMHPECLEACDESAREEGCPIEFSPGANPRGCWCEKDPGCSRCGGAGLPSNPDEGNE